MPRLTNLKPRIGLISPRIKPATTKAIARLSGGKWEGLRDRVLRRDNGLCQCENCTASGDPLIAHEVDHRIPLWEGGTNDEDNLQSINRYCHARKNADEAKRRGK